MSPDPFITTTDLVNYLGRGGTADPGMVIAVDAACDICRTIAEQTFNEATSTEVLDGTGSATLILKQAPVSSAGTVTIDGETVTDYVVGDTGILFRKDPDTFAVLKWPEGRQNVEVTYTHGYADADIPRDIRMVALAIASRLVVQGPALQETVGENSIRYAVANTDLTGGEQAILRKYRRPR